MVPSKDDLKFLTEMLSGVSHPKPRKPVPWNLWAKANAREVQKEFDRRCKLSPPSDLKKERLKIQGQLVRELFGKLTPDQKSRWARAAEAEHARAMERFHALGPPSALPADRQFSIERLVAFAQPILNIINDCTGMNASLFVGGPEPADGGRIKVLSLHSGPTLDTTFGKCERGAIKRIIVPIFGRHLRKSYTVEECKGASLPDAGSSLQDSLTGEDPCVTLHSVHWKRKGEVRASTRAKHRKKAGRKRVKKKQVRWRRGRRLVHH